MKCKWQSYWCIRRSADNGELFVTRGKKGERGNGADTTRRLSLSEASLLRRFFAAILVHERVHSCWARMRYGRGINTKNTALIFQRE